MFNIDHEQQSITSIKTWKVQGYNRKRDDIHFMHLLCKKYSRNSLSTDRMSQKPKAIVQTTVMFFFKCIFILLRPKLRCIVYINCMYKMCTYSSNATVLFFFYMQTDNTWTACELCCCCFFERNRERGDFWSVSMNANAIDWMKTKCAYSRSDHNKRRWQKTSKSMTTKLLRTMTKPYTVHISFINCLCSIRWLIWDEMRNVIATTDVKQK